MLCFVLHLFAPGKIQEPTQAGKNQHSAIRTGSPGGGRSGTVSPKLTMAKVGSRGAGGIGGSTAPLSGVSGTSRSPQSIWNRRSDSSGLILWRTGKILGGAGFCRAKSTSGLALHDALLILREPTAAISGGVQNRSNATHAGAQNDRSRNPPNTLVSARLTLSTARFHPCTSVVNGNLRLHHWTLP